MHFSKYTLGVKLMITVLLFSALITLTAARNCSAREDRITTESNMNGEDIYLTEYVEKIYQEYSEKDFDYVYHQLHPDIKEIITEKDYNDFQEKNFNKYKLRIDNIKVNTELEHIDLPDKFTDIVIDIEGKEIYKVPLSYRMKITVAGDKQTRQVDNQVYIIKDGDQYYLLWDPSIIKKKEEK